MDDIENEKRALLSNWYYEHGQIVLRIAFLYVKDQSAAEDITQEVFLRAYRKMEEFRGEANVATWLYRIAMNASKDYLRSWSRQKAVFKKAFAQRGETSESTEQQVIHKLNENELIQFVMKLPIKYREVIVLHFFEQMRSTEISELLAMNESTVRVRIKRGLAKLKNELLSQEVQSVDGKTII